MQSDRVTDIHIQKKLKHFNEFLVGVNQIAIKGFPKDLLKKFDEINRQFKLELKEQKEQQKKIKKQGLDTKRSTKNIQFRQSQIQQNLKKEENMKNLISQIRQIIEKHISNSFSPIELSQIINKEKQISRPQNQSSNTFRRIFQMQNNRVMSVIKQKQQGIQGMRAASEQETDRQLTKIFQLQIKDSLIDFVQIYYSPQLIDRQKYKLTDFTYLKRVVCYDLHRLTIKDGQLIQRINQSSEIISVDYITSPLIMIVLEILKQTHRDYIYMSLSSETSLQKWDSVLWMGKNIKNLKIKRCFFKYVFDQQLQKIAQDYTSKKEGIKIMELDQILCHDLKNFALQNQQEIRKPLYRVADASDFDF